MCGFSRAFLICDQAWAEDSRNAGTPEDSLRLNPQVLAGIYTCKITSWQDPAIAALNPGLS